MRYALYEQQSDLLSASSLADVSQSQPNVLCEHGPISVLRHGWQWTTAIV